MRVGTRITAATSALVAATLGIYAALDLGAAADRRRTAIEREAAGLAGAVRAVIETDPTALADPSPTLSNRLVRAAPGWDITVVPATAAHAQSPRFTHSQLNLLRTFTQARPDHLAILGHDRFVYAVPIRAPSPASPDGFKVVGTVEVSGSTADLHRAFTADLKRTVPVLVVIVVVLIVAVMALARRLVTRPITKLIAGIDDVAQGDLSRVLLSEREDEVGALASRFNAMTTSLRDSRAETERQNSAKMLLEERLSHTEKLATMGQLAAEIAHEVGTPLNVIAGRARTLAKKSADAQAVSKNANIIAEQALRITRIIQRLLQATRRDVMTTGMAADVDLNALTRATFEFLDGKIAAAGVSA
ncbi:MAG TPA: HAMP domain-containing protein, partial [Kofleriaceae bacterium]|nr:HAMP domain-containing protein [Kofleriaceae bacterium]